MSAREICTNRPRSNPYNYAKKQNFFVPLRRIQSEIGYQSDDIAKGLKGPGA
jgi:hypothetical protein